MVVGETHHFRKPPKSPLKNPPLPLPFFPGSRIQGEDSVAERGQDAAGSRGDFRRLPESLHPPRVFSQ